MQLNANGIGNLDEWMKRRLEHVQYDSNKSEENAISQARRLTRRFH